MPEVKMTIEPDGSFTIEVNGVKGPACLQLTKKLEQQYRHSDAQRRLKPEYKEQRSTNVARR